MNTEDIDFTVQAPQGFGTSFVQQPATQGSTSQSVGHSQHAPTMSDEQQAAMMGDILQGIVQRLQEQGAINAALREAINHTDGGSSGLPLKLPYFYGKAGENVTT